MLKQPQPDAGCRAAEKEEEEAREDQKDGGRTNALCGY